VTAVHDVRLAVLADAMIDDTADNAQPLMAWERELLALAQAESNKRLAGDLAAQAVLGILLAAMPSDVEIATWRIHRGSIQAQQSVWPKDAARTRAQLRSLTGYFVLAYGEHAEQGQIRVSATGHVDGVPVEFWEYVAVGCRCVGSCDHGVVSL
jgi:hypothetical protein